MQIDVLVPDRREAAQHLVGILARNPVDGDLEPVRVPGHDDVGEQGHLLFAYVVARIVTQHQ